MAAVAAPETPAPAAAPTAARIEVRSSDLLAVGTVQGNRMAIHLSRVLDNAPVRDAVVAVVLRGTTHAAVAETDGSYALQTQDLALRGPASIEFLVTTGGIREQLKGTLEVAGAPQAADDRVSSRQLGWWVLNFAVCIGFLWLWSRRKSAAP